MSYLKNVTMFALFARDMSLNLFRRHIMSNPTVQSRTVEGLLQLIENERLEKTQQLFIIHFLGILLLCCHLH